MICAALVTAGGIGKRMGSDVPKQYLDLNGIPVLARTLLTFERHPLIDLIVVTVPPGDEDLCRSKIVAPFRIEKVREIVPGGARRQDSVYNGLHRLSDTDLVAIHDGVRPLVERSVIAATIGAAMNSGAALAGVPVRETVKRKTDSHVETVPRSELWLAHTPQTFQTQLIMDAHRSAEKDGFTGTDDAALIERLGLPVTMVEDSEENIKITTREDLKLARLLLNAQEQDIEPNRHG